MAGKFKFDFSKVQEQLKQEESKKKGFTKDERFWNPDKKSENGLYIIRFLPDTEGTPFVKVYNHSFDYMIDGQKKWWIKNCVNTFGYDRDCPICKKNMEYWNSAFESDKAIASKRKRKLDYIANILVIKDPTNPDNEGTVKLFKFGQKIYDKIKAPMFPSETDLEDPDFVQFVPFDLYEGADFKLRVKQQGEFPNYGESSFGGVKAVGNDKKIDDIMGKTVLLSEFVAEDKFPTNEEVVKTLGTLLGLDEPAPEKKPAKKPVKEAAPVEDDVTDDTVDDDDVPFDTDDTTETTSLDEDEDFFKNLR